MASRSDARNVSAVADATGILSDTFRGLKATAKFYLSLRDEEIVMQSTQMCLEMETLKGKLRGMWIAGDF